MIDYEGFFENFPPKTAGNNDDFALKAFDGRTKQSYVIASFKDGIKGHNAAIALINFAKEFFNIDLEIEEI